MAFEFVFHVVTPRLTSSPTARSHAASALSTSRMRPGGCVRDFLTLPGNVRRTLARWLRGAREHWKSIRQAVRVRIQPHRVFYVQGLTRHGSDAPRLVSRVARGVCRDLSVSS